MVFRMRKLGCTKGRVVRARFLSRAHYRNRSNTGLLNFPEENKRDAKAFSESNNANVLNNTTESIGMDRVDKASSSFSPAQSFWLDGPESKKIAEETSEDLSSKPRNFT